MKFSNFNCYTFSYSVESSTCAVRLAQPRVRLRLRLSLCYVDSSLAASLLRWDGPSPPGSGVSDGRPVRWRVRRLVPEKSDVESSSVFQQWPLRGLPLPAGDVDVSQRRKTVPICSRWLWMCVFAAFVWLSEWPADAGRVFISPAGSRALCSAASVSGADAHAFSVSQNDSCPWHKGQKGNEFLRIDEF